MASRFSHMVYFTLKDSSDTACEKLLAACRRFLNDHQGTQFFAVGKNARTQREVVDQDYHVALHLIFEDRAAQDAYQIAPQHDEFIAEQKDNWQQVRVFDSVLTD